MEVGKSFAGHTTPVGLRNRYSDADGVIALLGYARMTVVQQKIFAKF